MQLLKKTILLQSHSARVLYRPPWFARIAELQGPSIKLSPGCSRSGSHIRLQTEIPTVGGNPASPQIRPCGAVGVS